MPVFTIMPSVVLVKYYGAPLPGLRKADRSNAVIEAKHIIEAAERGLNPSVYDEGDGRKDTGYQKYRNEKNVRIVTLFGQIKANKLRYVDGHWQVTPKGTHNVLCFMQSDGAGEIPSHLLQLLGCQKYTLDLWLNMKKHDESGKMYRLDTINLKYPNLWRGQSFQDLRVEGNTYELVKQP